MFLVDIPRFGIVAATLAMFAAHLDDPTSLDANQAFIPIYSFCGLCVCVSRGTCVCE